MTYHFISSDVVVPVDISRQSKEVFDQYVRNEVFYDVIFKKVFCLSASGYHSLKLKCLVLKMLDHLKKSGFLFA